MTETPFSFRAAPSDRDRLAAALAYLRKTRAAANGVGLLDVGDQDAQVSDGLLTELVGSQGFTYVGRAPAGGGSNAVTAAQQLVDQGAQAAFITGQPEQLARIASATQAAGISGQLQLLGLDGVGDYAFPIAAGDAAVGPVFAGGSQPYLTDQPETTWPAGYRDFVHRASRGYGFGSEGVEIQATPAFADCVMQWARAVQNARTFGGVKVARAWEQLDVPASETALGVRENASPTNHSTVPAEGVFVYSWVKSGAAYRLRQLAGPAAS
jgi:ABC-type branched-subunit amino acid transport system substrate-binding protein